MYVRICIHIYIYECIEVHICLGLTMSGWGWKPLKAAGSEVNAAPFQTSPFAGSLLLCIFQPCGDKRGWFPISVKNPILVIIHNIYIYNIYILYSNLGSMFYFWPKPNQARHTWSTQFEYYIPLPWILCAFSIFPFTSGESELNVEIIRNWKTWFWELQPSQPNIGAILILSNWRQL